MEEIALPRVILYSKGIASVHAEVDEEDFLWLSRFRWRLHRNGYAVRGKYGKAMHREILGLYKYDGTEVDHIDRDRLNNRKSNLRITTRQGNQHNHGSRKNSSSIYRGVSWDKQRKKWKVAMTLNSKPIYLGLYSTEEHAAIVAAEFRKIHMPTSQDTELLVSLNTGMTAKYGVNWKSLLGM